MNTYQIWCSYCLISTVINRFRAQKQTWNGGRTITHFPGHIRTQLLAGPSLQFSAIVSEATPGTDVFMSDTAVQQQISIIFTHKNSWEADKRKAVCQRSCSFWEINQMSSVSTVWSTSQYSLMWVIRESQSSGDVHAKDRQLPYFSPYYLIFLLVCWRKPTTHLDLGKLHQHFWLSSTLDVCWCKQVYLASVRLYYTEWILLNNE